MKTEPVQSIGAATDRGHRVVNTVARLKTSTAPAMRAPAQA